MKEFFTAAYADQKTPWEIAGEVGAQQLQRLIDREGRENPNLSRRALDVGCGRGGPAIALANSGWSVTGVDFVPEAIEQARSRAEAVAVTFLVGDATDLPAVVSGPFDLFLDVGCFHVLEDQERAAYGRGVTELAAPQATLLMFAFEPGAPSPLPRGVLPADIEAALPEWSIVDVEPVPTEGLPALPVPMQWYRLRRGPRA